MKVKHKKAPTRKCLQCKNRFEVKNNSHVICSFECLSIYNSPAEVEKRHKKAKSDVGVKDPEGNLQREINRIVRLLDKGHPCITSGRWNYTVHAGHLIARGANCTLAYNLLNIYAQADEQNTHRGGNGVQYWINIEKTFGKEVKEEIEQLPAKYPSIHLSRSDYKEATKQARKIADSLEKLDLTYTTEQRILLRKRFNQQIGIYK